MENKPYHHGNMQTELIEEGLALIHEEGMGVFSLRKLAKRVGVSPTACYNHYPSAEKLMEAMMAYVTEKFSLALETAAREDKSGNPCIEVGKAYVTFFAENPNYFSFIYDNEKYHINLTSDMLESDYEPFRVFCDAAFGRLREKGVPEGRWRDNMIVMWATVHGIAAMANMKGFHYDGEWGELAERILSTKLRLD